MEWISVKDDLPKPFEPVWIYWRDREVIIGCRTEKKSEGEPKDCWYSYEMEKGKWANWWMPLKKPKMPGVVNGMD